jgi:hypothetical protein
MNLAKGFAFALACGAAGAALWVGLAAATGWELTLVAIILGGAAGFGMGMGVKGRGGAPAGVLAAVAALVCILGAKAGVAHIVAQRWIESESQHVSEDDAREALRVTVYDEFSERGVEMSEPADEDSFPPEVWTEADRRWHAMSLQEREAYAEQLGAEWRNEAQAASGVVTVLAFVTNFGIFDLVCLGLALSTAYKGGSTRIGANGVIEDAVEDEPAQAPAMFRAAAAQEANATAAAPPAPEPAPPPKSAAPSAEPTGLGIFSILGPDAKTPSSPAPTRTPTSPARQPAPAPLPQQEGLINLDLSDDQRHAA